MTDERDALTFLDGPMGSELERRGVALPLPEWTTAALVDAPEVVTAIHRDYAAAGADVHTTATFRTTARALAGGRHAEPWDVLARRAVNLCRDGIAAAVPSTAGGASPAPHGAPRVGPRVGSSAGPQPRIAGSLAPLEDCYHPERTPDDDALAAEHGALARVLADAGVDLLLVETMPTRRELVAATQQAVATGLPVWAAVTLGPRGDFFDADGVLDACRAARDAGAAAFLLNCAPADAITPHIERLAGGELPVGAYGNCIFEGHTDWPPAAYTAEVQRWVAAGATLIGGCCGTTPEHLAHLRAALTAT